MLDGKFVRSFLAQEERDKMELALAQERGVLFSRFVFEEK